MSHGQRLGVDPREIYGPGGIRQDRSSQRGQCALSYVSYEGCVYEGWYLYRPEDSHPFLYLKKYSH